MGKLGKQLHVSQCSPCHKYGALPDDTTCTRKMSMLHIQLTSRSTLLGLVEPIRGTSICMQFSEVYKFCHSRHKKQMMGPLCCVTVRHHLISPYYICVAQHTVRLRVQGHRSQVPSNRCFPSKRDCQYCIVISVTLPRALHTSSWGSWGLCDAKLR